MNRLGNCTLAMTAMINVAEVAQIKTEFTHLQQRRDVMEDGILDLDRYRRAPVRILWILKQAPHFGEYHLPEWLARVSREEQDSISASPTWRRMAQVSAGLLRQLSFEEVGELSRAELAESLMTTAVIEIQKELGGTQTPAAVLREGYRDYGGLVKRQIRAYAPDVIIFAMGEEWIRKEIVEDIFASVANGVPFEINGENGLSNHNIREEEADVAFTRAGNVSFLWTTHPQYSIGIRDEAFFNTLQQAYRMSNQIHREKQP